MATSAGAAAARGIETGFGMGLRLDQAAEEKRVRQAQESRQAVADVRANEELGLRRSADQRQERRLVDAENRDLRSNATKALESRRTELLASSTAAQTAGLPVPPGSAEEYASVSARLQQFRQQALDDASRLTAGQIDLQSMSPAQAYKAVTVGSGMNMKDLATMPQHAADLQAGMESGNNGLMLKSINGLLGPRLRQGVGEEVPSGGKVVRKEVIRLVPAQDANGQQDPDKVFPVIRVYVQRPGDPQERYYDAPMTRGASVQDTQVEPISVKKALDWVGNLGVLTAALQRPDLRDKIAQGEKEVGPEVNKYFEEFNSLSKPAKKTTTREKTDLGDRVRYDTLDTTGKVTGTEYENKGAPPKAVSGTFREKLAEINRAEEDGDISPVEADTRRKALTSGIKPDKAGGAAGSDVGLSDKFKNDEKYRADVDYWAKMLVAGGELPPRFAQSGAGKAMFQDIIQRVPALGGDDPRGLLANKSEYGGAKAGARTVGQRSANFELAKSEAYAMADLVTEASGKFDRTDFTPINKALVAFQKNTGDVNVRQFGASINSFINAYARAVSPIGTPTVSDKDHAREMLSTADSHEQVAGIIDQLKKEMEAAGAAPKAVRGKQREAVLESAPEINEPRRGIPGPTAAAPAAPAGVRTATNPKTGEKLMLQNGQWVPVK